MKELHENIAEAVDHAAQVILEATEVAQYWKQGPHTLIEYQDGRRQILIHRAYPGQPLCFSPYTCAQFELPMPPLSPDTDTVFMAESMKRQIEELVAQVKGLTTETRNSAAQFLGTVQFEVAVKR